jgi:hypothetical protein
MKRAIVLRKKFPIRMSVNLFIVNSLYN